jgi:hypothetical protein
MHSITNRHQWRTMARAKGIAALCFAAAVSFSANVDTVIASAASDSPPGDVAVVKERMIEQIQDTPDSVSAATEAPSTPSNVIEPHTQTTAHVCTCETTVHSP